MTAPLASTFGGMLRAAAATWPERPAVIFDDRTWTFREFDEAVDEWARAMIALGIRRGERVALLAPNRPEWLLTAFAASRIGAVVAALNTWHKAGELASAIDRSESVAIFAGERLRNQDFAAMLEEILPARSSVRVAVSLEGRGPRAAVPLAEFLAGASGVDTLILRQRESEVRGNDDLFILFTSGSTAAPKGVVTRHDYTVRNDYWIGERQGLTSEDLLWLVVPLFYGFAAANAIAAAWSHGTGLVLEEAFDAESALDTIERTGATVYYGLGNMTRALIQAQQRRPRSIRLRKGLTGYSREDKRLAIEGLGITEICGIYGLTECHGLCAMTSSTDSIEVRLDIDGTALPGWELVVVDPETELPVPEGETGHLLARGLLSRGYFDDPAATRAAIREDGFLRTGDLVRIDAAGAIRFVSRLKDVIKVGGVSVSPREVESVLQRHPAVRQAFVVGVPDDAKGEAIVAVIEPFDGALATADDIVHFVRQNSAAYNTPARILFRRDADIPKLASGKASLVALRAEILAEMEEAG
jgi:fatty-acyl-CoA synthase